MLTDLEKKVQHALAERGEGGGIYSREIATYSGIDKTQISGVVSSLVKKGIVARDDFGGKDEYLYLVE